MVKKFIVAILSLCMIWVILPVSNIPTKTKVSAGMSQKFFSDEKLLFKDGKINNYEFKVGKGIIADKLENKNIVRFLDNSGNKDLLLSYQFPVVTELENNTENLYVSSKLTVEEIKGKKEFGLMIGAQRLDSYPKSSDTSWLYFKENEEKTGFVYGFDHYGENKEKTVLIENEKIDDLKDIEIEIKQYSNNKINLKIEGKEFNFNDIKLGHIGVGQSGGFTDNNNYVKAYISELKIINKFYSRPENTNLYADFNSGYVNSEEWLLRRQICIDNGELEFRNATHNTFIATKHKFSNFEMTFDITNIDRIPHFDDFGKLSMYPSNYFWVVYGLDADSPNSLSGYNSCVDYPESCGFRIYSDVNKKTNYCDKGTFVRHGLYNATPYKNAPFKEKYDLWNPHFDGRIANVRIRVVDNISSFEIKWSDEEEYTLIVSENLGYTPTGYILISGGWDSQFYRTNCSIDNIKIINLDKDPKLIEVGFSKSGIENNGDYEYTDTRNPAYMFGRNEDLMSVSKFPLIEVILTSVFLLITIAGVTAVCVILHKGRKNDE